jgi:hypothetical protein
MQNDPLQEENLVNTPQGRAIAEALKQRIEFLKSKKGGTHAES